MAQEVGVRGRHLPHEGPEGVHHLHLVQPLCARDLMEIQRFEERCVRRSKDEPVELDVQGKAVPTGRQVFNSRTRDSRRTLSGSR